MTQEKGLYMKASPMLTVDPLCSTNQLSQIQIVHMWYIQMITYHKTCITLCHVGLNQEGKSSISDPGSLWW